MLKGYSALRRIKALSHKEFIQVVRDPSSILIAFVLPVILLFLFGYGLSLDAEHIKCVIVLEDSGAAGQSLAAAFHRSRYFNALVTRRRNVATEAVVAGSARGFVVIPENFSRRLLQPGKAAVVQVISDGSEPNTAAFLEGFARGVVQNWCRQQALEAGAEAGKKPPGISVESRFWFNSELLSRNFLLPGCMTMILSIIGTLLTSMVVSREWERGTMESLLATPIHPLELVISKLIPYFVLGMISLLLATLAARLLFSLPFRGSVLALLLLTTAFLLVSLLLGLLISTISRNQFVSAQLSILLAFLPVSMLSGFVFEINSMPWLLQEVTRLVPARYYVAGLQTVFLAGDIWPVILPSTLVLGLMTLFLLVLTLRKSGKRID